MLVDHALRVSYLNQSAEFLLATSVVRCRGEHVLSVIRNGAELEAQLQETLVTEQSFTKRQAALVTASRQPGRS